MTSKPNNKSSSYFEKQRDALVAEISVSMDTLLNNVNTLNRSLEGAIAVGKEFDNVAAIWNNFYDGMDQTDRLFQKNSRLSPEEDFETPPVDSSR